MAQFASAALPVAGNIAGSLISGGILGGGEDEAIEAYMRALQQATGGLQSAAGRFETRLSPFAQFGQRNINALQGLIDQPLEATLEAPFDYQQFINDPGYRFRVQQGEQAINRAAAARGRFFAPSTLQDLTQFGQDLGSQEFGSAFDRFMAQQQGLFGQRLNIRNQLLNTLMGVTGRGQEAAGAIGDVDVNTAQNIANLIMGGGAAQGESARRRAQIKSGTITDIINAITSGATMPMGPGSTTFNPVAGGGFSTTQTSGPNMINALFSMFGG